MEQAKAMFEENGLLDHPWINSHGKSPKKGIRNFDIEKHLLNLMM